MGYFKVLEKDTIPSISLNFKTLEEVYEYSNENNGPSRDVVKKAARDVHFLGDKLASFHSSVSDEHGREWIIDYELSDFPENGKGILFTR